MKKDSNRLFIRSICIITSSFIITLAAYFLGFFDYLENKTYDHRMVATADYVPSSSDIYFVIIDQDSLDWAKNEKGWSWPWPREAYGQMIDFFNAGKVNSIIFDMFYTEASIYGDEDDEKFAQAMEKNKNVYQTIFVYNEGDEEKVVLPIDRIKNAAAGLGNVTSAKDEDDVIRRSRISYNYQGVEYPSLGLISQWDNNFDKSKLPLLEDETLLLRYQKSIDNYQPYNMADILINYENWKEGKEAELLPEDFSQGYIFFALYAPGLFDICSTSVSQVYPGVGVHITCLDNYLNDSFVRKAAHPFSILWILFLCIAGSFIVTYSHKIKNQTRNLLFIISGFIFFLLISIALPYLLFIPGIWLPFVAPLTGFFISFVFTLVLNLTIEGKQRRFIKSAFSQYLSPTVIDNLISNPSQLKLGGEKRKISIYFSDLEGFTSISEKLAETPEKLTEVLNKYLSEMTDIILESGGTIDKYEGDAIIAFWNAPLTQENHAERAILSALKCQERLQQIQGELKKMCGQVIKQRIGINTGYAVVGNMGSQSRFDYTMLGDSVNLASRLEGINKQFASYTMCSQSTKSEVEAINKDIKWRKIANVSVVGKSEAVLIYEPFSNEDFEKKATIIQDFEKAFDLFYKGDFTSALPLFEKNSELDPPSKIYLEKCRDYIQNPPDNWQGIWISQSK